MKKMNIKFLKINLNLNCYIKNDEMYFKNDDLSKELFKNRISFHYIYYTVLKKRCIHYLSKEDLLKSIPLLVDSFHTQYECERDIVNIYYYFFPLLFNRLSLRVT